MTTQPEQLWLLPTVPRLLEPGEPYRCLLCGRASPEGTYGPPGLESVILCDGDEYTVQLADQWLCPRHARARWAEYRRRLALVPARKRRLAAFRLVEAHGVLGYERFARAEALLASGWEPLANGDGDCDAAGVAVSYGKNRHETTISHGAHDDSVTPTAPSHPPIASVGHESTNADSDNNCDAGRQP